MKYIDHHVHTSYSPDSDADVRDYLKKAKELDLKYVMFTDHIDMGAIEVEFQDHINYDKYFKTMKQLEEEFEIPIRVGVEIGYEKNYKNQIDEFLSQHPFDFVISSVHYGDGKDFYLGDFFDGKCQYSSYMRYFEVVLEMVENFSNFEVIGHLDHIVRYGPFEDKSYKYKDYKEVIDNILKTIIEKDRGIELNTSGINGPLNTTFPKESILLRYRELGGNIITIGSDVHCDKEYSGKVSREMNYLKCLGFNTVSSFKQRKIKNHKL